MRLKVVMEGEPLETEPITEPGNIYALLNFLAKSDREMFYVLHLTAEHRASAIELVAVGALDHIDVHPREVFKAAVLNNSAKIVCCHNHPSGSLDASPSDIIVTQKLIKAGELLGIPLMDHVIISRRGYRSIISLTLEQMQTGGKPHRKSRKSI